VLSSKPKNGLRESSLSLRFITLNNNGLAGRRKANVDGLDFNTLNLTSVEKMRAVINITKNSGQDRYNRLTGYSL
jgi:hypothetical protein